MVRKINPTTEMTLDGFEERHLQMWLQKRLTDPKKVKPTLDRVKKWLESLSDEDFVYWIDRGWPDIYEHVTRRDRK